MEQRSVWRERGTLVMGSLLHGVCIVSLVYLTGLLELIGDYRQELYVLPGVFLGAFGFPLIGELVRRRTRLALLAGLLLAAAVSVGLGVWNSVAPVVTDTDLVVRSTLCGVAGVPIAVTTLPRVSRELGSRASLLRALAMGIAPVVMGIGYSLLYAEVLDFQEFASIVLANEVALAAILGVGAVLVFRRPERTSGGLGPGAAVPASKPVDGVDDDRPRAEVPRDPPMVALRRHPRAGGPLLLSLALAGVLLVPVQALLATPSDGPAVLSPRGGFPTPIRHVVYMMMENHAFDNFFGVYPEDPGVHSANATLVSELPTPLNLFNDSEYGPATATCPCPANVLPAIPNGTWDNPDPIEGYSPYHLDWDGGKMDGWLQGSGANGLNYYTANQLAPEWDLAEEYSLADNYFSSELTETLPNRLYSLAGWSPVINDYGPPPQIPFDETIFGELSSYGISWGYYLNAPSQGLGTLDSIEGMEPGMSSIGTYQEFAQEASSGTLPSVSWVEPVDGGLDDQYDQEPPGNVLAGEMWMMYFIDQVMEGPEWNSTAILITYDEGGGYYDQVAPPTLDGELLGERVPMLIISPYAKEAYISHTEMNHASQIAFIDYNWGLPPLNAFVAESNLPLDMFDFDAPPRAPMPFTRAEGFPIPTGFPFSPPATTDLASLFPAPLQIPLQERPYASTGSSSVDLSGNLSNVFVSEETSYTPVELSDPFLAWVLLVEVAVWCCWPKLPDLLGRRGNRAALSQD